MTDTVIEVENLVKEFGSGRHASRVLDEVGFTVNRGETVGVVGESGSGKSTTARCILRLIEPTSGVIRFEGEDVLSFGRRKIKEYRARAQMVFQDPYSSLDPRMCVEDIIAEGIQIHRPKEKRAKVRDEIAELLELVGIARALAVRPSLLICDEPVASLDVSIQAQILNLFVDLKSRLGLTMIYIAHDLATVRHLCDRIVVMQGGKIKEIGSREQIYGAPHDPYTIALMQAVPEPDPMLARERSAQRRLAAATAAKSGAAT
jgi:ABC-type oligopeptide transport system ATPase subunit